MMALVLSCVLAQPLRAETIYYSIRQLGYDGNAVLKLEGHREYKKHSTVLIVFKAKGWNFSDEEDIYVDPLTYKPLFVERDFNLGFFGHGKTREDYISSKGQIIITKIEDGHVARQIIKKSGVDNIYGFIYRYRKEGSFKIGDVLQLTLPTKDFKINLVNRAPLKIGGKIFDTFYMQSQPGKYNIWFDSSGDKWPLRIKGSLGMINSVMTMTGFEK